MTTSGTPVLHQLFANRLALHFGHKEHGDRTMKVLDLGCGPGAQLLHLTRLGYAVSGCEINQKHIATCIDSLRKEKVATIDIRYSEDSNRIPFESNEFDAVYSNAVFEHTAEAASLAAEVARVLVPGGIFLCAHPVRERILEPHLRLPFIHWFPAGVMQRTLVRLFAPFARIPEGEHNRKPEYIQAFLCDNVFYWTFNQIRQIMDRSFEKTLDLSLTYLDSVKHRIGRFSPLRVLILFGKAPLISKATSHIIARQWTFVYEGINPKGKRAAATPKA